MSTDLPIYKYKNEILKKLYENKVLIITGETGCGKSTQLPKYLYEYGYTNGKKIACLYPRRFATSSLAERVSKEFGKDFKHVVGYRMRFESNYTSHTKIIFMTTSFMLRLMVNTDTNRLVEEYSVIIIDEAHERDIQTDIMLGEMKRIINRSQMVKLIIMSATLNVNQFIDFYEGIAASVAINERSNAVKVIYKPLVSNDYILEINKLVVEIMKNSKNGDILIFLPDESSVSLCWNRLKSLKNAVVYKLFSSMHYEEKNKVFQKINWKRKIVVSTNIAETSITIPYVDYVIDSGAVMRVSYDHSSWSENWRKSYVSYVEAEQRKGRTGRTGSGTCYRLYEKSFMECCNRSCGKDNNCHDIVFPYYRSKSMQNRDYVKINKHFYLTATPQILEGNLASTILMIKEMGFHDVMKFPFIVPPNFKNVKTVTNQLVDLSLLSPCGKVTQLGRNVSALPLEPRLGKCVLVGWASRSRNYICKIVAMLSTRNLFKNSEEALLYFKNNNKDYIFLLLKLCKSGREMNYDEEWCEENFINFDRMRFALRTYDQLRVMCRQKVAEWHRPRYNFGLKWNIQYAFLSGFAFNIAKQSERFLLTITNKTAKIDRWCCLNARDEV